MEDKKNIDKPTKQYKVTVKHYIHERTREVLSSGEIHNPLYVQLTAKRQTTFFKSRIKTFDAPKETLERWLHKNPIYKQAIERERENIIQMTQERFLLYYSDFNIADITDEYKYKNPDFIHFLNNKLNNTLSSTNKRYSSDILDKLNNRFYGIHPLVLLEEWKENDGIKIIKECYSKEFWHFDFYYHLFLNNADSSQYVYALLTPVWEDYKSCNLQKEMIRYFDDIPHVINAIFKDIDKYLESEK